MEKETFPHPQWTPTNLKYACICAKKGGNIINTGRLIRAVLDFEVRVPILSVLGVPLNNSPVPGTKGFTCPGGFPGPR